MKKFRFIIAALAILLCTSVITSCSKSNDQKSNKALIEELDTLLTEIVMAEAAGEEEKAQELEKTFTEVAKELRKRIHNHDLTDEELAMYRKVMSGN